MADFSGELDMPKSKVLFLASECNPQWHSLPALVAEYYRALLDHAELTLVTHVRNKPNLENWLPESAEVHYIDNERVARPLYQLTQKITGDPNKAMTLQVALNYPSNVSFEFKVWKLFEERLKSGEFDIVHRASPMSPTIPSPMAKRCPVPFVIGPVQGGLPWPKAFKTEMRREGEWMNYFRKAHKYLPYYRSTYKYAAAILAAYSHTMGDIPKPDHDRVIDLTEGGIHPEDYPHRNFTQNDRSTILFVGRMVPYKQPEVLIRCVERSETLKQHQFVLVGDGPELPRLKALVKELNLENCIMLTGALPYQQVRDWMYKADIFAFPSIREQGGGVLTMASMASTPCVVVDYGGPSCRVPKGCGIKVPLGSVEDITAGFVNALESLVGNHDKIKSFGMAARKFTEKFYSWAWKAKKTNEIYEWTLGERNHKPDFWSEIPETKKSDTGQKLLEEVASKISF